MVTRKSDPTPSTAKRLYALSDNECAFPDCQVRLFDEAGAHKGKIAHIKAAEQGGPRYDPKQTDEERRAFENLLLLCGVHHDEIDARANLAMYAVGALRKLKEDHEAKASKVPDEVARALIEGQDLSGGVHVVSLFQSGGQTANTIVNVRATPESARPAPNPTTDACEVLALAVDPKGQKGIILCVSAEDQVATYFVAGHEIALGDPEHVARMEAALQNLVDLRLARGFTRGSGAVTRFVRVDITAPGYAKANDLSPSTPWWDLL